MSNFARVLPFVWPHRRKLLLSVFFAILVALFWGLNLSVVFPLVKVLVQNESLGGYVTQSITDSETEIAHIDKRTAELKQRDQELHDFEKAHPGNAESINERAKVLKDLSRKHLEQISESRRLRILNWVDANIIPRVPEDQFDVLAVIFGLLMLATVLKGICVFLQEVLIGSLVELTAMGLRKQCFRQTLKLDYQTLAMTGTAELMSRFTYDMSLLSHGLRLLGGKVIREPLKALVCIVGAFMVCWQLTLMSLLFAPLVAVVFYRIGKRLKQASHRVMESMSRIYKTLEETFDSMKVVIAFNGSRQHRRRFHQENKQYYAKALKIVKIDALTSPSIEVLAFLAAFCALLPACYLVLRDTTTIWGIQLSTNPLDIEDLALMYVFLVGIIDPARKLSTTYAKLKRATAAADRIFWLVDLQSLVVSPKNPKPMPRHSESITFEKIDFTYASKDSDGTARPTVLEDVSLSIHAGEVIVVVGENGSGKSTLVNLLPRYYDPDRGTVSVDGVDIREVRPRDLRKDIAVVTQETLLFDDSIYENIRYGKPDATRGEIEHAARQAHVTQFLDQLPDGFETSVGDRGQKLSGGQRQRVALARAILRDPSILILDEATSAIDAQSELLIHQALRNFVKGRTTFLITHSVSPSILDFVTRIVVMDQGRLIAVGPHEELIQSCTVYQRLFRAQTEQRAG